MQLISKYAQGTRRNKPMTNTINIHCFYPHKLLFGTIRLSLQHRQGPQVKQANRFRKALENRELYAKRIMGLTIVFKEGKM